MLNTFIITGEQGSGKTTLISEVVLNLQKRGFIIGGILAEGSWENNIRNSFELVDLLTGERIIYCQRNEVEDWEKIRNFFINPRGQLFGENSLAMDHIKNADLIVIDEIGPFELQGKLYVCFSLLVRTMF